VGHSLANLERFCRFFLGLPSRWRRYTGGDKEWLELRGPKDLTIARERR
jgi:hypothetical protein